MHVCTGTDDVIDIKGRIQVGWCGKVGRKHLELLLFVGEKKSREQYFKLR